MLAFELLGKQCFHCTDQPSFVVRHNPKKPLSKGIYGLPFGSESQQAIWVITQLRLGVLTVEIDDACS